MSKTQSVILNLNKNFANSKAHDYFQPVAQQVDIGENAEVCLYGATLQKKPIFINRDNEDNTFTFNIDAYTFPNSRQTNNSSGSGIVDINKLPARTITEQLGDIKIEAGAYSIDEFGQRLVDEINSFITQELNNNNNLLNKNLDPLQFGGETTVTQLPYSWTFENDSKDDLFMGFQGYPYQQSGDQYPLTTGKLNNSQHFPVDNNETKITTGVGLELDYVTETQSMMDSCQQITANSAISTTDYKAFARIHDSSIFPLFRQQKELDTPVSTVGQNESFFEFNIECQESANNKETDFIVGFTNTCLQSYWTTTDVPELEYYLPTGEQLPQCYLGVKIYEEINSGTVDHAHAEVFMATLLTEWGEQLDGTDPRFMFQDGLQRVTKINLGSRIGEVGKLGFRFYAVDNQYNFYDNQENNLPAPPASQTFDPYLNNRYPRVYGFQFYCRYIGQPVKILYDSKVDNIYIPGIFLEDGFLHDAIISNRISSKRTNLGFQPYLFVNELAQDDGISSPRGNYIVQKDTLENRQVYRYGMDFYSIRTENRDLLEILGIPKEETKKIKLVSQFVNRYTQQLAKKFDPNAFPDFKKKAGFINLYPENTQYNIEINLPIKAYTTTEPVVDNKQNLGQKRTILYKTEPVIEGNISGLNQAYVTKNVMPNTLKFLTLNNTAPLNLNQLNVQIRRAKTNELATELEDASVELLIKSN